MEIAPFMNDIYLIFQVFWIFYWIYEEIQIKIAESRFEKDNRIVFMNPFDIKFW